MRLWVLLLLLPLAGCLDAPSDALATPVVALHGPGAYALEHAGGDVTLASQDAVVALYDAQDRRIGQAHLRADHPDAAFRDMAPGTLVAHVVQANETVRVTGVEAMRALPVHMERHVLVDRPPRDGFIGVFGLDQDPVDEQVAISLLRAPTALRLLATGGHEGLHVTVRGTGGLMLEAHDERFAAGNTLTGQTLAPVPAAFFAANARDGSLDVHVQADHQDGALVLEAWSYSRANAAPATTVEAEMVFDHGTTEGRPVRVALAPRASAIGLQNEDPGRNATVAVFGPDDERLGVHRIGPNETVRVAAGPGGHVIAPLAGDVRILVDAVPQDFEVHPLEVRSATYPERVVGSGGRYEQREVPVDLEGVVFRADPAHQRGAGLLSCHQGATTVLRTGNETIGVYTAASDTQPLGVAPYLQDALIVVADGLGPDCTGPGVRVSAYVR